MEKMKIDDWLKRPDLVSIKRSSSELKKLLAKKVSIPENTFALIKTSEGRKEILRCGEEKKGDFELILIKDDDIILRFLFQEIHSKDDFSFNADVEIVVCVDKSPDSWDSYNETFHEETDVVSNERIGSFLSPELKSTLKEFILEHEAEELYDKDFRKDLKEKIDKDLSGKVFSAGLDFIHLPNARFICERFEEIVKEREKVRVENMRMLIEEKKKEAELEQKLKKDDMIFGQKMNQMNNVIQLLKKYEDEEDFTIPPYLKKILFESKKGSTSGHDDAFGNLLGFVENSLKQGEKGLALDIDTDFLEEIQTYRICAASGKNVYCYDPSTNYNIHKPREVFDFSQGTLGGIRSIKVIEKDDDPFLFGGARSGLYKIVLREEEKTFHEYKFAQPTEGRGGTNSVALKRDFLYASHSEQGLSRWQFGEYEKPAEKLFENITKASKTTRGVQVADNGKIYFASGSKIYSFDHDELNEEPIVYDGSSSSITTFIVKKGMIFAGNSDGSILLWELENPSNPKKEIARAAKIYMIKFAVFDGVVNLLIGAKGFGHGVVSRILGQDFETRYQADSNVRWVEGASDYVFAVDKNGINVFIWRVDTPLEHPKRINVRAFSGHSVHDLCIWKKRSENMV